MLSLSSRPRVVQLSPMSLRSMVYPGLGSEEPAEVWDAHRSPTHNALVDHVSGGPRGWYTVPERVAVHGADEGCDPPVDGKRSGAGI